MREHKIKTEGIAWISPEKRKSRFGGNVPPRPAETRLPLLWLSRQGAEVYLVNHTNETLELVFSDSNGFQTVDDETVSITSSDIQYRYENVPHGNAVKIEKYDNFYDLDFVLRVCLQIKAPKLGHLQLTSGYKKGGIGETVLLWDSGETGKNASVLQLS
ncbi:hypothetical protein [Vibrio ezurae]|uniref:Uncharacterized protein n=1 Tax=Vibrio ezurae NBRC 102218 TaxID=1219080 RepID=U3B0N1_9VIBR|nr:hypothetical protein [Vibrio ezurae]GAD79535.1 hypothetical protein VEZ01S_17_00220 [Vibrio ezurae NBRC 102218]